MHVAGRGRSKGVLLVHSVPAATARRGRSAGAPERAPGAGTPGVLLLTSGGSLVLVVSGTAPRRPLLLGPRRRRLRRLRHRGGAALCI